MSPPTFETLAYAVDDGVATITLNRPDRMNALNPQMVADLLAAFDTTDADPAVRAVIVTGAGKAFCAGADLNASSFAGAAGELPPPPPGGVIPPESAGRITMRIFDSLKPVIGAINGVGVGFGATVQLAMDIRLASTDARWGFLFSKLGVTLEGASSWFLPRLVGPSTTFEWCYSGRMVLAQEALDKGLVRSLHAPDELLPAARALARTFVDGISPVSVATTRQLVWRMMGAAHPMEAHRHESRSLFLRFRQADRAEGVAAFKEKRQPVFPDTVPDDMPDIWGGWTPPTYE
jgi:enoyl-CoA hydratase/carnithine racemase